MAWRTVPVFGSLADLVPAQVLSLGGRLRYTLDLTAVEGAYVYVKLGRGGVTAIGTAIDLRFSSTGAATPAAVGDTHPAGIALSSSIAAATSVTVDADSASGQNVLNVSTTTGFVAGDLICLQDAGGGVTRLEWARVSKITNAGASGELVLSSNLTFTHTAAQADTVRNKADVFPRIWLAGGSIWAAHVDYGASATGDSITAMIQSRTLLYYEHTEV